jgi:serine protease AprX
MSGNAERLTLRWLARVTLLVVASLTAAFVAAGASWASTYDSSTDGNSMDATTAYTGAQAWWRAGFTGEGIDVAVIDSGVAPVEGLSDPGKVIFGPDLSLESQAPNLSDLDTFGHGTFMAGLIAGRDAGLTTPYVDAPASAYRGMAPDARIVSIKVATADGGADVSQVIAAIDWVVQHAHDPGMNIRVLNLSYGTNTTQAAGVDPLAYAVEQAWKHGIVVVAAAGNTGYGNVNAAERQTNAGLSNTINDPGNASLAITVGSTHRDAPHTYGVSFFSSKGPTGDGRLKPDLVAPGERITS